MKNNLTPNQIVKIHKALSDLTRFKIFDMIWKHHKISGKALLSHFNITQPTLSFHIAKLESAGVINVTKEGQTHYYAPRKEIMLALAEAGMKCLDISKKLSD